MNSIYSSRNHITTAISGAIVAAAAPALVFLGAGTAQAIQDVSERGGIAIIDDLPLPRDCGKCGGFNPQPDPPGNPDPSSDAGVGNPNDAGVGNPNEAGVGNPDERSQIDPDSNVGIGNPNDRPSQTVDPSNPHVDGVGPHVKGVNL